MVSTLMARWRRSLRLRLYIMVGFQFPTMDFMTLRTVADVEEFAASIDSGQLVEGVRLAESVFRTNINRGDFEDPSELRVVRQWIDRQVAHRAALAANTPEGLARRNTEATERAAFPPKGQRDTPR